MPDPFFCPMNKIPWSALAALTALAVLLPVMSARPLLLGSALAVLLLSVLRNARAPTLTLRASDGLIIALLAWLAAGTFLRAVPWTSVYGFWAVATCALGYLLLRGMSSRERAFLVRGLVSAGALLALASLVRHQWLGDLHVFFSVRNNQAAFFGVVTLLAGALALAAERRRPVWMVAATLCATALWLTGSRAAGIAFVGAAALFIIALVYARLARASLLAIVGPALVGYGAAVWLSAGHTLARAATLADPLAVGASRLALWESAWPLVRDAPWFGHGLITTYAKMAAHRPPLDTSAGHHLHNDYLQYALEAGWVAALLWLALAGTTVIAVVLAARRMRASDVGDETVFGLAAACAAALIFAHTAVDFDLQVVVLLALTGLLLALGPGTLLAGRTVTLPDTVRRPLLVLLAVVVGVKALLYVAFGLMLPSTIEAGDAATVQHQLARLRWAIHIEPRVDVQRTAYVDLIRQAAPHVSDDAVRLAMYQEGRRHADRAVALNPGWHLVHFRRAQLLAEFRELVPDPELIATDLARAVAIDPRLFIARTPLMRLHMDAGRHAEAWALGVAGLEFRYINSVEYLEYLDTTIAAGLAAGTDDGLARVRARRETVADAIETLREMHR